MTQLPDWFCKRFTPTTKDTLPDYHARMSWPHLKADELDYLNDAMAHGCEVVYDNPNANGLLVATPAMVGDEEVVFAQLLGTACSPRDMTFAYINPHSDDKYTSIPSINRTSECAGTNLWETEKLADKLLVCSVCGKHHTSLSDMKFYPFAGLGCPPCADKATKYFFDNHLSC